MSRIEPWRGFRTWFDSHRPLQKSEKFTLIRLPLLTGHPQIWVQKAGFCTHFAPKSLVLVTMDFLNFNEYVVIRRRCKYEARTLLENNISGELPNQWQLL